MPLQNGLNIIYHDLHTTPSPLRERRAGAEDESGDHRLSLRKTPPDLYRQSEPSHRGHTFRGCPGSLTLS